MTPETPPRSHTTHPPDAVDRLLSDFFKNELPRPWPAARATAVVEPSSAGRSRPDGGRRARYTLAASVAALLGLGIYLSSGTPNDSAPSEPGKISKSTADGKDLLDPIKTPMPMPPDPMPGVNMP